MIKPFSSFLGSGGKVQVVLRIYLNIAASTNVTKELVTLAANISQGQLGELKVTPSSYSASYVREL